MPGQTRTQTQTMRSYRCLRCKSHLQEREDGSRVWITPPRPSCGCTKVLWAYVKPCYYCERSDTTHHAACPKNPQYTDTNVRWSDGQLPMFDDPYGSCAQRWVEDFYLQIVRIQGAPDTGAMKVAVGMMMLDIDSGLLVEV